MEVLLANPRGFCACVDRAIEIVERALALHDVSYHDVWEALTALEPPIAAAAARQRQAADLTRLETLIARHNEDFDTVSAVEQAADFFHAVGEATHNRVFMLARNHPQTRL